MHIKRGVMLGSFVAFFLITLLYFVAANCYSIDSQYSAPAEITELTWTVPDSDCSAIQCADENPLTPAMYDTGSCVFTNITNCNCKNNGRVQTKCNYEQIITGFNSTDISSNTSFITTTGCHDCGCGFFNSTSQKCESNDPAGDGNCRVCECNEAWEDKCKNRTDTAPGLTACRKCDSLGNIIYAVGDPCQYDSAQTGICDSSGSCVLNLQNCSTMNGINCSINEECSGSLVIAHDNLKCCIGKCQIPILLKDRNCTDVGKICNITTEKCLGTLNITNDTAKCCIGRCELKKCTEINPIPSGGLIGVEPIPGKICSEGINCAGYLMNSSDSSKCCIGKCEERIKYDWKKVLLIIGGVILVIIGITNPALLMGLMKFAGPLLSMLGGGAGGGLGGLLGGLSGGGGLGGLSGLFG